MDEVIMEIAGHEIKIKRDLTVRKEWYYCILGVSKRKVIYGSSPEIVYRRALRSIEKGEVSFDPFSKNKGGTENTIPF